MTRRAFLGQTAGTVSLGLMAQPAREAEAASRRAPSATAPVLCLSCDPSALAYAARTADIVGALETLTPVRRLTGEAAEFDAGRSGPVKGTVASGASGTSHSAEDELAATLFIDDGGPNPAAIHSPAEIRSTAYDAGAADTLGMWFGADECFSRSAGGVRACLPLGLFAGSLGLWSSRPLRSPHDLVGLRLAADPDRFGFLSALGVELVDRPAIGLRAALSTGAIDLALSAGASQDAADGLFDAGARCYNPGFRDVVATAWMECETMSLAAMERRYPGTCTRLEASARAAVTLAYARDSQRNGRTLGARLDQGFRMRVLPDAIGQALYRAHAGWRTQRQADAAPLDELRDRAERLARLNQARYFRHVG